MPENSGKYAVRSSLLKGRTDFAKQVGRCASAVPANKVQPADLVYETTQDILQLAAKRASTGLPYSEFKELKQPEKDRLLLRDPNCHFERNIKKYSYEGAASRFVFDLNSEGGVKHLGHVK